MKTIAAFLAGLMLGGTVGVFTMSLCVVAGRADEALELGCGLPDEDE